MHVEGNREQPAGLPRQQARGPQGSPRGGSSCCSSGPAHGLLGLGPPGSLVEQVLAQASAPPQPRSTAGRASGDLAQLWPWEQIDQGALKQLSVCHRAKPGNGVGGWAWLKSWQVEQREQCWECKHLCKCCICTAGRGGTRCIQWCPHHPPA